nr:hypothetical protein [Tanacetum cinerariifolium]
MESEGQVTETKAEEGSLKQGKSLKRPAEEELGHEQQVEEKIVHEEDVVAKQDKKEISKKSGERLKRNTSKAREDKDERQKKQDDPEKLTLMDYVEDISDSKENHSLLQKETNGKLLANSISEGPYQYTQVLEPDDENSTQPNQFEANEIPATRIAKSHNPLALYSKTPTTTPYALVANTLTQAYSLTSYTPTQTLPFNNIIVQQPTPNNNNNNNTVKQQPFPIDTIIDVNDPLQAM